MDKHYDIGVVGCWYWGNYGSLLNGYATFRLLKSFGLSVLNIVTPYNGFEPHTKKFFETVYSKEDISASLPFERVSEFNKVCDMFLTGSDQIWNYNNNRNIQFDEYFKLDFVERNKKRISFSTSFGNYNNLPTEEVTSMFSYLLKKYTAVSVREDVGINICRDHYGVDATQVMEPVLDVDVEIWHDIAEYSSIPKEKEPYIITYILDPTPEKRKAIQYYSDKLGIKAINIVDGFSANYEKNKNKLNLQNTLSNIWCADFLKYFKHSSFVITDSFHGTAFALAFNKTFISIANYGRGISRFETLLGKVGLMDRLINDKNIALSDKFLNDINYSHVNEVLSKERERSVEWLKNAIFSKSENKNIMHHVNAELHTDLCMGCGACVSCCPTNAISLIPDKFGLYRSVVDSEKCTNCGLCTSKCAALKLPHNLNAKEPFSYAFVCADKNILMASTSGGAFYVFAENVINRGGLVVGASMQKDFSVSHIIVDNVTDLKKLQKSKYLQSYLGDIFFEVKKLLSKGILVLFSGCPCQIVGLKKYLDKEYSNLILVDLLCATCPSKDFFKKYLEQKFNLNEVTDYKFRSKNETDKLWNSNTVAITKSSGVVEIINLEDTDYYKSPLILSPSHCRRCQYQGTTRFGDLTIGDCWGVQNYDTSIDPAYGVSAILVNNVKGETFLNSIPKEKIKVLKEEPLEQIKKYNVCAFQENRKWPINPKREVFLKNILDMPFKEAMDLALKESK